MATYRVDLAYDGSGFHGFARQRNVRTVQGELEAALATLLPDPVETTCAGRTDSGVHARRQVVSFQSDQELDADRVRAGLDGMLGAEVAVASVRRVAEGFDARFSATWRSYRYFLLDGPVGDPLTRWTTWHVPEELDVARMDRAVGHLVGAHDFASFCRAAEGRSAERTLLEAGWERVEDRCVLAIRASAFCHQMVRSIVGYCVEVGRGRLDPDGTPEVLSARDRAATRSSVAPPHGLVLWDVGYEDEADA